MPVSEHSQDARFISRLTRETLALILAGGQGSRLRELTTWRAKPALYFGGKYRIIDFPLSNCINSGIRRIGVLTQYKAHSLIRHLVHGWSWFQAGAGNREFVEILPASQRVGGEWYRGTADAVYQNLDIIRTHEPRYVLILAGDHIYKMDYGPFLAFHADTKADMTICCLEVPLAEAAGTLGVMTVDETGRIIAFDEKPEHPNPIPGKPDLCLASMGNYIFNTEFLYEQTIKDADTPGTQHDFGRNVIPAIISDYRAYAYPFRDPDTGEQAYWRDVGTLDAFWEANMEMVSVSPQLNLYDNRWPVLTHQIQSPPAKFVFDEAGRRGEAIESMVSGGCIVSGAHVSKSLLFSRVQVHSYSSVTESVVLPAVDIGQHCRIRRAIIDRGAIIEKGTVIGEDHEADRSRQGTRIQGHGQRPDARYPGHAGSAPAFHPLAQVSADHQETCHLRCGRERRIAWRQGGWRWGRCPRPASGTGPAFLVRNRRYPVLRDVCQGSAQPETGVHQRLVPCRPARGRCLRGARQPSRGAQHRVRTRSVLTAGPGQGLLRGRLGGTVCNRREQVRVSRCRDGQLDTATRGTTRYRASA
jgi:glucose-1-phosphate adenylyltransferase